MKKSLLVQKLINLHSDKDCLGYCPFHRPSDHHMKGWKIFVRFDRGGLVERLCTHGVGHPDPDSLLYLEGIGRKDDGVHGCCGCCSKERDSFIKHLERATKTVSKWPKWKKDVLGKPNSKKGKKDAV